MSRVFAYCRVSTAEQTTLNQVDEVISAGFNLERHRIVSETVSGSVPANQRREFVKLRDRLEEGDILIVTKLDRLGRNAFDVRSTIEGLASSGIRVHCLALGNVDLTSASGRMTMSVIAAVAEFERDLLIERTNSGLKRAKAQGKSLGRPKSLTSEQELVVRKRLETGVAVAAIARELKTSRQTVMRVRAAPGVVQTVSN